MEVCSEWIWSARGEVTDVLSGKYLETLEALKVDWPITMPMQGFFVDANGPTGEISAIIMDNERSGQGSSSIHVMDSTCPGCGQSTYPVPKQTDASMYTQNFS